MFFMPFYATGSFDTFLKTFFFNFKREYPGAIGGVVGAFSTGDWRDTQEQLMHTNNGWKTSTWETNIGIEMITML